MHKDGDGCGCHDARAFCAYLTVASIIGAGAGLVTGIISDVQVLRGRAETPHQNWWNPFQTNTSPQQW